jgi:hypothetical protein
MIISLVLSSMEMAVIGIGDDSLLLSLTMAICDVLIFPIDDKTSVTFLLEGSHLLAWCSALLFLLVVVVGGC